MKKHKYEVYIKSNNYCYTIETDFPMKIDYKHRLVWFGNDVFNLDDVSAILKKL